MKKLESLFTEFEDQLKETIEQVWLSEPGEAYLEGLTEAAQKLSDGIIQIAENAKKGISTTPSLPMGEQFMCYVINYLWPDQAKSFLILWRDVIFQHKKAHLLLLDDLTTEEALQNLKAQSKTAIEAAAAELIAYPEKIIKATASSKQNMGKRMEQWKHQENPWPAYREQIDTIPKQCQGLYNTYLSLRETSTSFLKIREYINQMLNSCDQEMNSIKTSAQETINFIDNTIESPDPKPGKIALRLEDLEEEISMLHHLVNFTSELEQQLAELPEKTQVSIEARDGWLLYKEINFRKSAQQWMESEILPVLYEVWELTENISNGMKMSLVNIRNRTIILSAETKEGKPSTVEKADLCQPLLAFLKKLNATKENLTELEALLESRLQSTFRLSEIYTQGGTFLPIPLESTINQLKLNQNVQLNRIQDWLSQQQKVLRRFKTTVEREESLSISEKIVRYIQNRSGDETNNHYNSIFLTKGYIGESFWVGRAEELRHIESLINNWKNGFRGAVAITGQRFAGKSLFGDLVANRYFPDEVIRLLPNTTIKLQGRSMTTTYDLGEALDFIRKHTLNARPLVWIDDLELWWDPTIPISQNVRALRKYIDNYSSSIFFLVSMGNWLKVHLNRLLEMDFVFQAEINVDQMSAEEIREAILIRHGATHKNLIDAEQNEASPQQFRKMTGRIIKASEGNIGEALNRWSASTQRIDEDRVTFSFTGSIILPNFINTETGLVLRAIMMEKRTNEYRLRKLFGPVFSEKYSSVLQRLINVGILTRQLDGWLEINELVVNDLGRMLERKRFLKFHK
ncbi:MAG: hypothetical protein DHS20C18_45770 [Saprospiraceae bacterium]|nr:MAG: hypothetical protein DHS20C18_45770 [Saprospiraceae bacterium]